MVISDSEADADPDDARIRELLEGDWPAGGERGLRMLMRRLAHELRAECAAAVEPHDRELARQIRTGRTAK